MNSSSPLFQSVSIILPVMDETTSLAQTVNIILQGSKTDIKEFIIVVCDRTTAESMAVIADLQQRFGDLIHVHHQKLPFVGGAIREAFDLASATHLIIMASDLETNPGEVGKLIAQAKVHPEAIIATSRWLKGGNFSGYSKMKLAANWIFQHLFSILYSTRLTDMTFAYRLYPTNILRSIKWEELRHPFFFETIVKPLRLGIKVIEIPSTWTARSEGQSHNRFRDNFDYFRTGLRVRFLPIKSFLREQ